MVEIVAPLISHLWQSFVFVALMAALATVALGHSAHVRLWLWRLAAAKWLVPFSVFTTVGGWLGFPVRFPGDPPPASAIELTASISPWFDAGSWVSTPTGTVLMLVVLLVGAVAAARGTFGRIHDEAIRARIETLRLEVDPDDREPSLGFTRAALFTASAMIVIAVPMLGGAVRASSHAHELLQANTRALSNARVTLRPARPGLGSRYFVDVDTLGVWIRNITVRELTGMAYGVNRFFVRGQHFRNGDSEDWLVDSRYDVRIDGPVREPKRFDTYALRHAITRELAQTFGLEIYVNNECQKPCGKWGDRELIQVAPDSWRLVQRDTAPDAERDTFTYPRQDEPALSQFKALLSAFNSGDRDRLTHHLVEHVSVEWTGRPAPEEAVSLREQTGGFDVETLEQRSPNVIYGWVRARTSGVRMAVIFSVESEPPHRISLYRFSTGRNVWE